MLIEISNADAISFIIDPNVVTATKKDIEDHDASKTAHAAEFEKKADVTDLNAHANNTDIHVNPSTMGNYDTAISGLIEHKEDTKIHVTAEEKASWTEGAEQAAADANRVTEALNAIAGIESRVSRVEDGPTSSGGPSKVNPYSVTVSVARVPAYVVPHIVRLSPAAQWSQGGSSSTNRFPTMQDSSRRGQAYSVNIRCAFFLRSRCP